MKRMLVILGLLAACSSFVATPGTTLVCETIQERCPELEEVQLMLETFDSCTSFDTTRELNVHWFDSTTIWHRSDGINAIGYSDWNGIDIYVTGWHVMAHELMHVKLGRDTGDMDANHSDPPGPWTHISDEKIREIETLYDQGQMCND